MNMALLIENFKVVEWAWPGGYPIVYYAADGEPICGKCINENMALCNDDTNKDWFIIFREINWEQEDLVCANCGAKLPCAYPADTISEGQGATQAVPDGVPQATPPAPSEAVEGQG